MLIRSWGRSLWHWRLIFLAENFSVSVACKWEHCRRIWSFCDFPTFSGTGRRTHGWQRPVTRHSYRKPVTGRRVIWYIIMTRKTYFACGAGWLMPVRVRYTTAFCLGRRRSAPTVDAARPLTLSSRLEIQCPSTSGRTMASAAVVFGRPTRPMIQQVCICF